MFKKSNHNKKNATFGLLYNFYDICFMDAPPNSKKNEGSKL